MLIQKEQLLASKAGREGLVGRKISVHGVENEHLRIDFGCAR